MVQPLFACRTERRKKMVDSAKFLILMFLCEWISATKVQELAAKSGEEITLPCQLSNKRKNLIGVEWSRSDLNDEYVLLYRDDHIVPVNQHPSFKNRVDLQDRQMKDGNMSLILKDVKTNDTGTYECHALTLGINRRKRAAETITSINLIVSAGQPGGVSRGRPGLSVFAVIVVAAAVGWIYRKHKQHSQNSHCPTTEPQIQISERFLNSESAAAEQRDRNDLEANNCHLHPTRIPDTTLTLEDQLRHPPPQETAGLFPERNIRVQ